jgi:hypothetical protein
MWYYNDDDGYVVVGATNAHLKFSRSSRPEYVQQQFYRKRGA